MTVAIERDKVIGAWQAELSARSRTGSAVKPAGAGWLDDGVKVPLDDQGRCGDLANERLDLIDELEGADRGLDVKGAKPVVAGRPASHHRVTDGKRAARADWG